MVELVPLSLVFVVLLWWMVRTLNSIGLDVRRVSLDERRQDPPPSTAS